MELLLDLTNNEIKIQFFFYRNPQSGCSFISENYRSSCVQVYNYHRLLTWDSKLGLHMDIFKVPSCCSCHVHGYADIFPPHQKDPPSKNKETFPGSDFITTSEQKEDYEDVSKLNYLNKFSSTYDTSIGIVFINSFSKNTYSYLHSTSFKIVNK